MNQIKIGKFIAECRKKNNLTQLELAEKLGITDRAVSKWENGKSMPDSSIMLELCAILKISVNDLLCGEVISMENYKEKSEQLLIEMQKQKEETDKQLLILENVIGVFSIVILLGSTFAAAFFEMNNLLRIIISVGGFIICMIGIVFALRIEQTAGYYECNNCKHKYVPSFFSVFWAMHIGRTRYLKCPKCNKRTWSKKVLTKE